MCDTDLVADKNQFNLPSPLELSWGDLEIPEELHAPLLVSVTRGGKRKVTGPVDKQRDKDPQTGASHGRRRDKEWETPPELLTTGATMHIMGAAMKCPGTINNPIKLECPWLPN